MSRVTYEIGVTVGDLLRASEHQCAQFKAEMAAALDMPFTYLEAWDGARAMFNVKNCMAIPPDAFFPITAMRFRSDAEAIMFRMQHPVIQMREIPNSAKRRTHFEDARHRRRLIQRFA